MSLEATWVTLPLPEVLEFREGPGIMARDFRGQGVPLIRLTGLKRGSPILQGCNYLDPDMVEQRWSHFRVRPGDVLLSTSASLGEVAVVDGSANGAIPYTGIIAFRPRTEKIILPFIQYALRSPSFRRQIEAMGTGSVMRHFGPTHLKGMTIDLPSVRQQSAIAHVLGALDDKVAANQRVVRCCDNLRRLVFNEFVLTRPDEIVSVPLSSLADFMNGRAFTRNATSTGRMVVRIAELSSGPSGSTVYNDIDVPEQHVARPGDVLFAWSGSLTVARWFREESIINQHIFKVIPRPAKPAWLIFELVSQELDGFRLIAAGKATTMGHIQRHHLDKPVPVPVDEVVRVLDVELRPLWDRALAAEQESLALSRLRDILLPLLMSGKIKIRDA